MNKNTVNRDYDVKFTGLSLGEHIYHFDIDQKFFKEIDNSLIEEALVQLDLSLNKQDDHLFLLNFNFDGKIALSCDRCLNEFWYAFQSKHTVVMKASSDAQNEDGDDILYVSPHDYKINISQHINEFILMHIPMKAVCSLSDQECSREMLKKLEKYTNLLNN